MNLEKTISALKGLSNDSHLNATEQAAVKNALHILLELDDIREHILKMPDEDAPELVDIIWNKFMHLVGFNIN